MHLDWELGEDKLIMGAAEEKQVTIFLSHASEDKPFVDWLYDKLRSTDLLSWYDKYEILVGDSVITKVGEGLKGSELLIVVISQSSVKSNWVQAELEPKILEQIEGQHVSILPVVLGKAKTEDISIFLKGKRWIRFPRKGSDEKFQELLRSIEGQLKRHGLLKTPNAPLT
jgi:TIR domain